MPTDRPVPVSINPSSPSAIFFSFPSIFNSLIFHLLLCISLFISFSIFPFPLHLYQFPLSPNFLFLLPLDPAPSLVSHAGLWSSYWPGRLFSNVLPDQSRLWNSPESWIIIQKLIQNYVWIHSSTGTQARSVNKQVDSLVSPKWRTAENGLTGIFQDQSNVENGVLDSAPVSKPNAGWCRSLYCRTLHIHPHTAMLYSAMLTVPRGKYCAELQAQCHVRPDRITSELDRTRTKPGSKTTWNGVLAGPDSRTFKTCGHNCKQQQKRKIIIIMMMIKYKS